MDITDKSILNHLDDEDIDMLNFYLEEEGEDGSEYSVDQRTDW